MGKPKPKWYVVWEGERPGVYDNWTDTEKQVSGFPNAKYKSFSSRVDALRAYGGDYFDYAGKHTTSFKKSPEELARLGVELDSVAVDAACQGNPGAMEYRGVEVATGAELFRVGPYPEGTNNVGEFLAIVHALALLKREGLPDKVIYSDSRIAAGWVRDGRCRSLLEPSERNAPVFELIRRAETWLEENAVTNPIVKWETKEWGEIPADYGRK